MSVFFAIKHVHSEIKDVEVVLSETNQNQQELLLCDSGINHPTLTGSRWFSASPSLSRKCTKEVEDTVSL